MAGYSRRRRNGGSPTTDTHAESIAPVAASQAPAAEEKKRGGILGWFQDAGDWVADKYDSVTETVGNAIDTTKRVAGDVWDVVQTTDVGFKDGKLTVDTDLDEVMDLMPDSISDRIQLGDGAENRISLSYDTKNNSLTASSKDLEIEGMDFEGLKSGNARVQDMSITVTNPADAMAFLEGTREFLGDDRDGVDIDIQAGQADVKDLQIGDGTSIQNLSVSDLKASASNADGLPFGDQARQTSASFSAGAAKLDGVIQGDTKIDSVDLQQIAGGLSEKDETAFLEAGSVKANGVNDAAMTAGNLGAKDVRVDIGNEGGGMVFLDDKQDHMAATVTASSATVGGMETMGANVGQANVGGLMLQADQDTSTLDLAAATLSGSQIGQGGNSVGGIDAAGLDVHYDPNSWSADLDSGSVTNAALLGIKVDQASVGGLSAGSHEGGVRGSADSLSLKGAAGDDWRLGSADLGGLSGGMGADGGFSGSVSSLDARSASGFGGSVDRLKASDLSGGMNANGGITGRVATVDARGASGFGGSVDHLSASGISGGKTGDNWNAALGNASISGGVYGDKSVDAASVTGVNARGGAGGITANLDSGSARGIVVGEGSSVDSATVGGVALKTSDGGIDAQVDTLGVKGVGIGDVSLAEGNASGVSARVTDDATALGVDTVSGSQLRVGGFSAGSLSGSDADVQLGRDGMSASLANAQLLDAGMDGVAHVDKAVATGLSGGVTGDRRHTDVDALSIEGASHIPSGTTVNSGRLTGLHGTSQGDAASLRLDSGAVSGVKSDGFSVNNASVGGVAVDHGPNGTSGSVDHANAKGLAFTQGPSSGSSGGDSGFDSSALIRSGSRLVDDANLSVSVPVAAGEYKSGVGLDVDRDTRLDANLAVRDNRISGLNARFENPVDGPLWTSLRGLYTEDNKLQADVGGWFDQNLTKSVNEAMGLDGKRLHSLGTYGNAVAGMDSSSSSTSSGGKPGLQEAFDLGGMTARGNASLSAGTLDTGNAQVTLGSGRGANVFSATSGNGQLTAGSEKVLIDRTQASVGGANVSTGAIAIDGTQVALDTAGRGEGTMSGSVEEIDLNDLKFRK